VELRLRRAFGHAEQLGNLVVFEAFDVVEHEDGTCARRQTGERAFQIQAIDDAEYRARL
jgi:hypothetical protein